MSKTASLKSSIPNSDSESFRESDANYSTIYDDGLQVVDQDSAPEVVSSTTDLHRKSSFLQPEPYRIAPYEKKEAPPVLRPEYEGLQYHEQHNGLQYYDERDGKEPIYGASEVTNTNARRRCCGLPRRLFIILIIVAMIILIGVILGAVLGTLLPKKWAKDAANAGLQTISGTGLASTIAGDGSGRLLTYFQDPDGRILENSYLDGTWTLANRANADVSVVTTQAAYGSQLAAISYQYDDKAYRQICFVTSTGAIMTVNSTETTAGIATNWGTEQPITDDRLDPKGIGLAACWSDQAMNGIRAFYPCQYGYINEFKWTFGEDKWVDGHLINSSDPKSGVGCAIRNMVHNQYVNL